MKRKLYIATYSAHATILEKLSNNLDADIEKLYVSYGGFKAPKGSYNRNNYSKLFNGRQSSKNVLHAKVILNDCGKKSSIWIWTGNLRKSTNSSQNILLSLPINGKNKKSVIDWFSNLPEKHLIIDIGQNGIESIKTTKKLFNELKENINSLKEDKLKAYVFSPWGSSKFLQELSKLKNIKEIRVYTRNALNNCWVDYKDRDEKIKHRFMAKELTPFPHSKSLFLTNQNDEIVWAYIGSANFTKAAMFEKKNVECAAIFKDSIACSQIEKELKKLTKKQLWDERDNGRSGEYDDSGISYEDDLCYSELDSKKGFERRCLIRDAEKFFSQKKIQCQMEKKYKEYKGDSHKPLLLGLFKFKITSIDDYYHLLVSRKKKNDWVEVDVERIIQGEIPESILDVSTSVTRLFNLVTFGILEKKDSNPDTNDSDISDDLDHDNADINNKVPFVNIRFPIEKIMKNAELKKAIREQAEKIKKTNIQNLPESDKILLSNWLPLIERLK